MSKQREALELALEALEKHGNSYLNHEDEYSAAIKKIREALAEPEQKPVAWMLMNDTHCHIMATEWKPEDSDEYKTVPLYTAQPALKISQKEIGDICNTSCSPIQAVIKMMVKFNIQLADKNSSIQQWIKDEENEQTT